MPRSAIATAVTRRGLPVPIAIGVRFALERGRGRSAVPVRPALVGAVMGVLGVVAAFTFSHGVTDAADHPERFGQTFQAGSFIGINGKDFAPADELLSALIEQPQVAGVDDARTGVATAAGGNTSVSVWAYSAAPKPIPMVVLSGRAPETAGEIVLGPRTSSDLGAEVGGTVRLTGDNDEQQTLRVVGTGLMPVGPHNGYADGAWVTQNGYDTLFDGFKFHLVLVTLAPSAQSSGPRALAAAIAKDHPTLRHVGLERPDAVPEVAVLKEVRRLPTLLGIFLAVLAVGAVGHALATAVRRRSHDLAVLRALGLTQWQCRWTVVTQATVLALIGLLFGVPIGLAVGRTVWRVVADYTPIQYVPPIAATAMLLVWPAALLLANLLAAWPGRRAARLRISTVLRAE